MTERTPRKKYTDIINEPNRERNQDLNYKETRSYNYKEKTNIDPNLEGAVGGDLDTTSNNRLLINLNDKDPSENLETEIIDLNKSFSELNISREDLNLENKKEKQIRTPEQTPEQPIQNPFQNLFPQPLQPNNMSQPALGLKQFLSGIQHYKGDEKELDAFINNCDLYWSLAEDNQKNTLLNIIKAKLSGEVLQKIGSLTPLQTWPTLKAALREGIKPLISFAGAQEAIMMNKQIPKETIRQFGTRMKKLLEDLNNTQHILNSTDTVKLALRSQNEKQSIIKYTQNILNPELQRLVSASTKDTLDESIAYAYEKEMWIKSSSLLKCSLCNKNNHLEFECKLEEQKPKETSESQFSNQSKKT